MSEAIGDFMYDNPGTTFLLMIALIFIIIFAILKYQLNEEAKLKEERHRSYNRLIRELGLSLSARYEERLNGFMVGIDEQKQKVLVAFPDSHTVLDFSDILSVKLVVNGNSVISRSTGKLIGASMVGGLVGAMAVDQHVSSTQYDVHVDLNTRKFDNPTIRLTLLAEEVKDCGSFFTDEGTKVVNLINIVIDRVAQEQQRQQSAASQPAPQPVVSAPSDNSSLLTPHSSSPESPSVADELRKLADLRAQGILSDAEFDDQKRKLLNN